MTETSTTVTTEARPGVRMVLSEVAKGRLWKPNEVAQTIRPLSSRDRFSVLKDRGLFKQQ